jgi:hypothetical protein
MIQERSRHIWFTLVPLLVVGLLVAAGCGAQLSPDPEEQSPAGEAVHEGDAPDLADLEDRMADMRQRMDGMGDRPASEDVRGMMSDMRMMLDDMEAAMDHMGSAMGASDMGRMQALMGDMEAMASHMPGMMSGMGGTPMMDPAEMDAMMEHMAEMHGQLDADMPSSDPHHPTPTP